jgi:3-oxoadipate enol-lactonase
MIQGLGADKHGWDMQRLVLALRYRVIALDNRGAGRSDKPFGHYSLEQMAADAIAVLDQVGVEKAHVVGASMGGAISQIVALQVPRARPLAHPRLHRMPQPPVAARAAHRLGHRRQRTGMGAMTREAARWVIGPRSFRRLLPAFGWLGPLAMGRTTHAFVAQVRAILASDESISDRLDEITVTRARDGGQPGHPHPARRQRGDRRALPNAELVVISGAAHGFMVEHATTFNRVLFEFLDRVTSEQAAADVTPLRSTA